MLSRLSFILNWDVTSANFKIFQYFIFSITFPDSKVRGANMGPTWGLWAPDGPHIGPINLAIRVVVLEVFFIKGMQLLG